MPAEVMARPKTVRVAVHVFQPLKVVNITSTNLERSTYWLYIIICAKEIHESAANI